MPWNLGLVIVFLVRRGENFVSLTIRNVFKVFLISVRFCIHLSLSIEHLANLFLTRFGQRWTNEKLLEKSLVHWRFFRSLNMCGQTHFL